MEDGTHHLLRLRGILETAIEVVDRLATDAPPSEAERTVLGVAASNVAQHSPRTRADVLRFAEAVKGGDEGWLVIRSVPGEHRTEAVYTTKMPTPVRKALGI